MIDIHSHILWGLDDGAQSLEESVAMAHVAAQSGTTDIVATAHANHQYNYDPVLIRERAAELQKVCGDILRIHVGSDFHLSFGNIESALENPRAYTINQARYLMVELPESVIPPDLATVFERMHQAGMLPVITHPERNRAIWLKEEAFESWIANGCYVQITAQSLFGHFGRSAKERSWRLLEEGKVDFIASDGHNTESRPPRLDGAWKAVEEKFGRDTAQQLFVDQPKMVLEGTEIRRSSRVAKRKNRFRFFR